VEYAHDLPYRDRPAIRTPRRRVDIKTSILPAFAAVVVELEKAIHNFSQAFKVREDRHRGPPQPGTAKWLRRAASGGAEAAASGEIAEPRTLRPGTPDARFCGCLLRGNGVTSRYQGRVSCNRRSRRWLRNYFVNVISREFQ